MINLDEKLDFFTIKKELSKSINGIILDIGCGKGTSMGFFQSQKIDCIGIDISLKELKYAKQYGDVILASGTALPFVNECFELVSLEEILHHTDNPKLLLQESRRLLKKDGKLFLLESVEDDPFVRLLRSIQSNYEDFEIKSRFYSKELTSWLDEHNFIIIESKGRRGFPFSCAVFILGTLFDKFKMLNSHFNAPVSKIQRIFEVKVKYFRDFSVEYDRRICQKLYLLKKTIDEGKKSGKSN